MIINFKIFEIIESDKFDPTYKLLHLLLDKIIKVWKENKHLDNWHIKDYDFGKIPVEVVQRLIDEGANVNVHDETNNTGSLLHMAVERRDMNLIKCLIKNGANVNAVNSCNSTPIYYASNSDIKILKYLIDSGGDVNIPNNSGVLPLHHAVYDKKYDNAILLLNSGSKLESDTILRGLGRNQPYKISNWIKEKNYKFQKFLCEKYPEKIAEIIPEQYIHKRIMKEYGHLFTSVNYDL